MDPALPGFGFNIREDRISKDDAEYVDIIHTCAGVLGILEGLGHADFYPNGGKPAQPGCLGLQQVFLIECLNIVLLKCSLKSLYTHSTKNCTWCYLQIVEACSHGRSWKVFAESIVSKRPFLAHRCNSWSDYKNNINSCDRHVTVMGYPSPFTSRGSYFLTTSSTTPFVQNDKLEGACKCKRLHHN